MGTSTTVRVVRAALFGTAAVLLWAQPGSAAASEYAINACQADRANFSTQAFDDFATRGMMWKRACDPEGPGLRGLVTSNVPRAGRVARGSRSYFVMNAPAGTRFARFTWSGQARRRDCRYALQLWASRPDGPPVPIKNVRANTRCPRRGYAQAAGWPRPHTYDINGATKIVQRIVCVGERRAPHCSSRGLNYIRTFKAQATVVDVSPPAVSVLEDNPFTQGQWVSGRQTVNYVASDNVGVKRARAIVSGRLAGRAPSGLQLRRSRFRVRMVRGRSAVETRDLGRRIAGAGCRCLRRGRQSRRVEPRDRSRRQHCARRRRRRPSRWRRLGGTRTTSTSPGRTRRRRSRPYRGGPLPDLPVQRAVTAPKPGGHGRGISALSDLAVPAPGEWQLRVWREDAAGNHEPSNASVPVPLRFDPEPPQLAFEQTSSSDPDAGLGRGRPTGYLGSRRPDRAEPPRHGHLAIARYRAGRRPPSSTNRRLPPPGRRLPAPGYRVGSRLQPEQHRQTGERRADGRHACLCVCRPSSVSASGLSAPFAGRSSVVASAAQFDERVVELQPRAEVRYGERVLSWRAGLRTGMVNRFRALRFRSSRVARQTAGS